MNILAFPKAKTQKCVKRWSLKADWAGRGSTKVLQSTQTLEVPMTMCTAGTSKDMSMTNLPLQESAVIGKSATSGVVRAVHLETAMA